MPPRIKNVFAFAARSLMLALVATDFASRGQNAEIETRRYKTLAEYQGATGQDADSELVDYDIFASVPRLDRRDIKTVQQLYDAKDLDFRLKPGASAIDRGTALPDVTDGFSGKGAGSGRRRIRPSPTSLRAAA